VVEADRPAPPRRLGTDPEQAEVVVVARARHPQESGVGARLPGHHLGAEGGLVERQAALEVGDEEDRVVEADGVDGHQDSRGSCYFN
jgi:hypothetical protein